MSLSQIENFLDATFYFIHYQKPIELINKKGVYIFASCPIRDAIQHLAPYTWNRPINEVHVKTIELALREMKVPHLIGTIKVIHCNNKFYVYDGQHRIAALSNVLKDDIDMIWNIEINMEIYQFTGEKNIQENEIAQYLFDCANKTIAFEKIRDAVDPFIKDFLIQLVKDPLFIDNIKDEKCSRPKISTSDLYKALKTYYKPKEYPSILDLIKIIKQKNNELCLMSKDELMAGSGAVLTDANYTKAKKSKFFLNLATYPPSKWINEIN